MKRLYRAVEQYLALRRALGFKLRPETWWLPDFVSFLDRHGSSRITTALALRWARQPSDADPNWWARRLGAVRQFAKHHQAFDPRTEIPAPDLLPHHSCRTTPHIYEEAEILALMDATAMLRGRLISATYATLIGLLAASGMRVSEAIGLNIEDVDTTQGRLTIWRTKFLKSRHVPIHPETARALSSYACLRDRLCPHRRDPAFFVSSVGTRLLPQNVSLQFDRLRRAAGLVCNGQRRPRIHDLRHTFAVRTLRDWYRAGSDVERELPVLSTYLGHVSPSTTYWYLTATPELLALASHRAERAWRQRP